MKSSSSLKVILPISSLRHFQLKRSKKNLKRKKKWKRKRKRRTVRMKKKPWRRRRWMMNKKLKKVMATIILQLMYS